MQRYPTTAIAALVGILVVVAASAVLLGDSDAASQRFGLLLGIAGTMATGILATFRGETSTRAARRADEGVQEAKAVLNISEAGRAAVTGPALAALVTILERTEAKVDSVEHKVDVVETIVANGTGANG